MISKLYVYSHNIYIYVSIFSGNILCLVLNIIFSHFFKLYLQVMEPKLEISLWVLWIIQGSHALFLNLIILFNVMFW
jgi:hypothetical protein